MMPISFTKMNSQGNNFIVIDNTNNIFDPTPTNIKSLCTQESVDCDQLLLLNIKTPKNIFCRIFNNDASEALQCGNGLRAIMLYLKNSYGIDKNIQNIESNVNIAPKDRIFDENRLMYFLSRDAEITDVLSEKEKESLFQTNSIEYYLAQVDIVFERVFK